MSSLLVKIIVSKHSQYYLSSFLLVYMQERIQRGFAAGQVVWNPTFLSQINEKLKILK